MLLPVWVIYDHPADFPDGYVLRPQYAMPDGTVVPSVFSWEAATVEELYAVLPPGLVKLMPMPGDDPVILETWL